MFERKNGGFANPFNIKPAVAVVSESQQRQKKSKRVDRKDSSEMNIELTSAEQASIDELKRVKSTVAVAGSVSNRSSIELQVHSNNRGGPGAAEWD